MKIEVGKTYIARNGKFVTIKKHNLTYPFLGDNGQDYTTDGRYYKDSECDLDLIAEAEEGVAGEITVRVPAGTIVLVEYEPVTEDPDDTVKRRKEEGPGLVSWTEQGR